MIKFSLTVLLLGTVLGAMGQPLTATWEVALEPTLGLQQGVAHWQAPPPTDATPHIRQLGFGPESELGGMLRLRYRQRWYAAVGYHYANLSTTIGMEGPTYYYRGRNRTGRISLLVGRSLKKVQLISPRYTEQGALARYSTHFDLQLLGGLSRDFLNAPDRFSTGDVIVSSSVSHNGQPMVSQAEFLLSRTGWSVWGGLRAQFQNGQRDRLALTFYYALGLQNLTRIEAEFNTEGGGRVQRGLDVRGTAFGVRLSYPILLYRAN